MKLISIVTTHQNGAKVMAEIDKTGQFGIHRVMGNQQCWTVTHLATGRTVIPAETAYLCRSRAAVRVVAALLLLRRDWSRVTPHTISRWSRARREQYKRAIYAAMQPPQKRKAGAR